MKRLFLISLLPLLYVSGIYAQKANVRFQDTQARLLDVASNAYVKPLIVELKIDETKGRVRDEWALTKEQVEIEMQGDIENIRSYAVYMSSQKHNADVIVAATFNLKTNEKGTGYQITVVGYPATFENWKTAQESDYEWIRIEKFYTTSKEDRQKLSAIIK